MEVIQQVLKVTPVFDTNPQLGGNLDLNGNDITGTGSISITGGIFPNDFVEVRADDSEP